MKVSIYLFQQRKSKIPYRKLKSTFLGSQTKGFKTFLAVILNPIPNWQENYDRRFQIILALTFRDSGFRVGPRTRTFCNPRRVQKL